MNRARARSQGSAAG